MRLSENRVLAWIVLAVVAVGSVFGLGGGHLAREHGKVMDLFYDGSGSGTARESMDAYLDKAAECARLMSSEAKLHLGADDATAAKIDAAIENFGDDAALDIRYAAYTELQGLSDELYNRFFDGSVSDADRVNFKVAYDDFWGADKFVQRDPYREAARDYNDSLDGFPADVVAGLFGLGELNTFGA